MTEAMQQPAHSAPLHQEDRVTIVIHRGLHDAALHLAHHHITAYAAYLNAPALDHDELKSTLEAVLANGVEFERAMDIADALCSHLLPALIAGKQHNQATSFMLVVTDCETSLADVEGLLQVLREAGRR